MNASPATDYVGVKCERCGHILTYPADTVREFIDTGKCGACLGHYSRWPKPAVKPKTTMDALVFALGRL